MLLPLEFLILLERGWEKNSPRVRSLTREENKRLVSQKWMIRQSTQMRRDWCDVRHTVFTVNMAKTHSTVYPYVSLSMLNTKC